MCSLTFGLQNITAEKVITWHIYTNLLYIINSFHCLQHNPVCDKLCAKKKKPLCTFSELSPRGCKDCLWGSEPN